MVHPRNALGVPANVSTLQLEIIIRNSFPAFFSTFHFSGGREPCPSTNDASRHMVDFEETHKRIRDRHVLRVQAHALRSMDL